MRAFCFSIPAMSSSTASRSVSARWVAAPAASSASFSPARAVCSQVRILPRTSLAYLYSITSTPVGIATQVRVQVQGRRKKTRINQQKIKKRREKEKARIYVDKSIDQIGTCLLSSLFSLCPLCLSCQDSEGRRAHSCQEPRAVVDDLLVLEHIAWNQSNKIYGGGRQQRNECTAASGMYGTCGTISVSSPCSLNESLLSTLYAFLQTSIFRQVLVSPGELYFLFIVCMQTGGKAKLDYLPTSKLPLFFQVRYM